MDYYLTAFLAVSARVISAVLHNIFIEKLTVRFDTSLAPLE